VSQELLDELVELLDIEELETTIFRGLRPQEDRPRVFGGQVAAQALVAAERTVPQDRRVHSLHSYFLRPGDMGAPILYIVDRIRDGGSFTTRRVVAIQHGEAIFNLSASFQKPEVGLEHQLDMPVVPAPESLPKFRDRMANMYGDKVLERLVRERPVDIRWCDPPGWKPEKGQDARGNIWMRADGNLPEDPSVHRAVLVYCSDYTLMETVMRPHGVHWMNSNVNMAASLDHCIWFHSDMRADSWWGKASR
jgi:acyl-CoA thioesterase-2